MMIKAAFLGESDNREASSGPQLLQPWHYQAFAGPRAIAQFLFGISPLDAVTFCSPRVFLNEPILATRSAADFSR